MDEEVGERFHVDGGLAVLVQIRLGEGGDAIAIHDAARAMAAEMAPTPPQGVEFTFSHSLAGMIVERLAILTDNALTGPALVLVLVVPLLFRNARRAPWVAAGIPVSLLATAGAMWVLGLSINLVSLFGLILTLGIIVDDAVVVGEHADHLARRRRMSPTRAAEAWEAACRMAAPVFASALTTAIAVAGLLAVGGRFGRLAEDIPLVVCAVLAASLAECFLVLRNHMRHALEGMRKQRWHDAPSRLVNRGFDRFVARIFRHVMGAAIRLRYPLLGICAPLLALSAERIVSGDLPWRFWNAPERNGLDINVAMLAGAERADMLAQIALIEDAVRRTAAHYAQDRGTDPLVSMLALVGGGAGRGLDVQDDKAPWQLGAVKVELVDADLRPCSAADFRREVSARLRAHPLAGGERPGRQPGL